MENSKEKYEPLKPPMAREDLVKKSFSKDQVQPKGTKTNKSLEKGNSFFGKDKEKVAKIHEV